MRVRLVRWSRVLRVLIVRRNVRLLRSVIRRQVLILVLISVGLRLRLPRWLLLAVARWLAGVTLWLWMVVLNRRVIAVLRMSVLMRDWTVPRWLMPVPGRWHWLAVARARIADRVALDRVFTQNHTVEDHFVTTAPGVAR